MGFWRPLRMTINQNLTSARGPKHKNSIRSQSIKDFKTVKPTKCTKLRKTPKKFKRGSTRPNRVSPPQLPWPATIFHSSSFYFKTDFSPIQCVNTLCPLNLPPEHPLPQAMLIFVVWFKKLSQLFFWFTLYIHYCYPLNFYHVKRGCYNLWLVFYTLLTRFKMSDET